MVSIEGKYNYLEAIKEQTSLASVVDFIFFSKLAYEGDIDVNNPQHVTNYLMSSIINGDEKQFSISYDAYKVKSPDERSPWINNNYLLFFFLIGSIKFKADIEWLRLAISKRKRGLDKDEDFISDFFYNLANGNYQNSGKFSPLVLCFKYFLNRTSITKDDVNGSLEELNRHTTFPFYKNEFLNILFLKSFDIAIKLKDSSNVLLETKYKRFESVFLKRVDLISNLFVYLVLSAIILVSYRLLIQVDEQKRNTIITLLGLGGITVLEFFKLRAVLRSFFSKIIKKFFGHHNVDDIIA